jgi:glycerate dehydrogenase
MPTASSDQRRVLVTFPAQGSIREELASVLDGVAGITYLTDLRANERAAALGSADVVLAWFLADELRNREEFELLASTGLIQMVAAGVDQVPFDRIPDAPQLTSNAGAYAEPMAEHVLAMALALAKRLPQAHAALARGEFDQRTRTRAIRGSIVGLLGFGGVGQATATLFRALGAHVHAVNTSGQATQPVDWIGTTEELTTLLGSSDILVISLPLTRATAGLIGEPQLSLMKRDAILINIGRAAVLDEEALYEHLRRNPSFSAGLDVWWQEPNGQTPFSTRRPFFGLPNILGSPHNSAVTAGSLEHAARCAAENIRRYLLGDPIRNVVQRSEYTDAPPG